MARAAEDVERLEPADRAAWRAWLAAHHARPAPVWLVLRKGRDAPLTQDAAVEEALCFGWIDSLPRKLDEQRWMLLVSPRKPRSPWSRVNKARVERLVAAALMAPPGLSKVAAAQADGSWDVYEAAESLEEPAGLTTALAAVPDAAAAWARFAPSARKGILWWIAAARTPETRAKRMAETARLAAMGLRANFPESRGR